MPNLDDYITVPQAVALLADSPCPKSGARIRKLLNQGRIAGIQINPRLWLVHRDSLLAWEPLPAGRPTNNNIDIK